MIQVLVPSPALDITYLIDDFQLGAIHRPADSIQHAGGKGLNLARAARRLGLEVEVVTELGGRIGARVAELAVAEGLRIRASAGDQETRLCITVAGEQTTEIYERAPSVDINRLMSLAAGESVVISGSVQSDVGGMIERVMAADTSGPALRAAIDAGVRLIKVNRAEAADAMKSDGSAVDLARMIHARGVELAVVTDGAAGSAAVRSDGAWIASADPQPGTFAVGSGDSFFAGLLAGLDRRLPLQEVLGLAAAAGSANTRHPGAGVFTELDVDRARERTRVVPA